MSYFDDASLVMIPSGKKAGKVYSVKPTDGTGDLDFTRASTATRIGSDGNIEKTRTNNILYSNDFNTGFSKTRASMVSGQAGYDGTNDAWSFVDTADNSTHLIVQTVASSQVQTFSVYAKAGAVNFIVFRYEDSTVDYAYFDLANGILGTVDSDYITAKITSVGNGWYRCEAARTSANKVVILSAQSDNDPTYAGAGTTAIYIQDSQLEQGLVATSYIETTSAAVSVGSVDNMPRLNYTAGSTSSCPSLLLEPQRTNLYDQSEYLEDSPVINNLIITTNAAISPEGLLNATKQVPNTTETFHWVGANNISPSSGVYTASIFAKPAGYDYLYIVLRTDAGGKRYGVKFNIANGTFVDDISFGSPTQTNYKVENYGNGWYRCSVSSNHSSGSVLPFFGASPNGDLLTDINNQFGGDGTSGIHMYGAQVEEGSYSSSYIPSYGATVTRVADACNNGGSSVTFNDSEGVLFAEISALNNDSTNRIISVSDGSGNNRIVVKYDNSSNIIEGGLTDGGVDQASIQHSYNVVNNAKIAFKYKANDFALWVNGVEVGTDNSGTTASGLDTLNFDNGSGGSIFLGNAKKVLYFSTALTDTQLAELTS
jgi:hypothetical protein